MRFKLRSSARDDSADAGRLSSVERALLDAIAGAESEKKGLQRRLDNARARASALLGNDTFGDRDREPKSEQLLQQAENDLIAAGRRIHNLTDQIEHFGQVLDLLKRSSR